MIRQIINSRSLVATAIKVAAVSIALAVRSASGGHEQAAEPAAAPANADDEAGKAIHGVSLGDYRIRSYYQVDAQKSTVRFSLFATVKDEHYHEVQTLVEEHREKLRDQVIMATRLAPLSVFQEPDLTTFRRRILVRLRRALPELTIEDLYLSEFDLTIKSL
jgi:flagellar basal body-associated protein FliL